MRAVFESISQAIVTPPSLDGEAPPERKAATGLNGEVSVLLKALDTHLVESDPVETSASFNKVKSLFAEAPQNRDVSDMLAHLEEEVNQYNYDEAREILNQFAGMIK
jgi:hypothetical protein